MLRAEVECDKVLRSERGRNKYRRLRRKRRKMQREFEKKEEKQESDDIHIDLDRIVDLAFGYENTIERGIVYEGNFHIGTLSSTRTRT